MKRILLALVVEVVALVMAAPVREAAAQGMPVYKEGTKATPGTYPDDTQGRSGVQLIGVKPDSIRFLLGGDGIAIYVTDPRPFKFETWQSRLVGVNLAAGGSDSTAAAEPIDVSEYPYLKLLVKANTRGATTATGWLGIELREQLNGASQSDSNSTFVEYRVPASASGVDTVSVGHLVTGSSAKPWSGQIMVPIQSVRSYGGAGGAGATGYPPGVAIMLNEVYREHRFGKLAIKIQNKGAVALDYDISVLGWTR